MEFAEVITLTEEEYAEVISPTEDDLEVSFPTIVLKICYETGALTRFAYLCF